MICRKTTTHGEFSQLKGEKGEKGLKRENTVELEHEQKLQGEKEGACEDMNYELGRKG